MAGAASQLFDQLPDGTPDTLSKRAFAEHIGVTPGRVTQLIDLGLPVEPNGRIHVERGLQWYEANTDPNRRKGQGEAEPLARSQRPELERIKVERQRLALGRERGDLVERAAVERLIFERARAERDAHLAWVTRTAPALAQQLGADPARLFTLLDRAMRDHLAKLAETPIEDLSDGRRGE